MAAMKLNSAETCEQIIITLTKEEYPVAYNNKIEEFVEQGLYLTKEEAERQNPKIEIDCEIYYHKHSGVFEVEQGAVESGTIYSPYSGEICEEYKEGQIS